MPHTRNAEKRVRQSEKRRLRNRAAKKAIKTNIKSLLDAVKAGNPDTIKTEYRLAIRKLDKAAAKRVVHPNLAARKKSQLAKLIATKK
jgi:small subunit ribosomal protein S20